MIASALGRGAGVAGAGRGRAPAALLRAAGDREPHGRHARRGGARGRASSAARSRSRRSRPASCTRAMWGRSRSTSRTGAGAGRRPSAWPRACAKRAIEPTGFLVQRMAAPGVELLLGVAHDPLFGPVIACGAGGVTAEVMKDVAVRITPLTDRDARGMLRSLRTYPLLEGFRGAPRVDIEAVEYAPATPERNGGGPSRGRRDGLQPRDRRSRRRRGGGRSRARRVRRAAAPDAGGLRGVRSSGLPLGALDCRAKVGGILAICSS